MEARKIGNLTRQMFFGVAILALLANGYFDYIAFQENKTSDRLGNQVTTSVQAERALNNFERIVQGNFSEDQKVQALNNLENYIPAFPRIRNLISNYKSNGMTHALKQEFRDIDADLDASIESGFAADRDQNSNVNRRLTTALAFDLFLFSLMFVLFITHLQAKLRIDLNLRKSHKNLLDSLTVLEKEMKKRALATKSAIHDLKNPIGTIIGFASLIRDESSTKEDILEVSERIQKISERSLLLVERLLKENLDVDFSNFNKINIAQTAQDMCVQLKILADAKNQKIHFYANNRDIFIQADEVKLDEIFSNLIGNAIKYAPLNTSIFVSVEESQDIVRFTVKDQGPGFSNEDKAQAFKFAGQLSAKPTGGESSSGIGLFSVKQLVNQHKAFIVINDNDEGTGAKITVTFPTIAANNEHPDDRRDKAEQKLPPTPP